MEENKTEAIRRLRALSKEMEGTAGQIFDAFSCRASAEYAGKLIGSAGKCLQWADYLEDINNA